MRKALFVAVASAAMLAGCDAQEGNLAGNAAEPANIAENGVEDVTATDAEAPLGPAVERETALKLMHDRHENMEAIGDAMKATGQTLKSDSPDLAVIRSSAAEIAQLTPHVPSWFPPGTGPEVGKTHAKPDIWQTPEDFAEKAAALNQAAQAFHAAAQAGDMDAIRTRFGELGKTCKACHDLYREKDD